MNKLIIDGNNVYEVDEDCMRNKEERDNKKQEIKKKEKPKKK